MAQSGGRSEQAGIAAETPAGPVGPAGGPFVVISPTP